jgi:serine/threonine protein phosphatase PrpC
MNAWGITDTGKVREQNQDAYRIVRLDDDCLLCVVCDGMGGALAGNVASELAAESFAEYVKCGVESSPEINYEAMLQAATEHANEVVFRRAAEDKACHGMGTTLVAALVAKKAVHMVNMGDSRGYFVDEHGIRRITRDHSLVEDLVERGRITPEEARLHPQKNLITRALGVDQVSTADYFRLERFAETTLLLCTDGLTNVMEECEIFSELKKEPADDCCNRLLAIALERGAPDNVTAVLVKL